MPQHPFIQRAILILSYFWLFYRHFSFVFVEKFISYAWHMISKTHYPEGLALKTKTSKSTKKRSRRNKKWKHVIESNIKMYFFQRIWRKVKSKIAFSGDSTFGIYAQTSLPLYFNMQSLPVWRHSSVTYTKKFFKTESTKFFKDGGLYVRLDLANKGTRSYGLLWLLGWIRSGCWTAMHRWT